MKDYKNIIVYPTLKDVAECAGVSPITVSRVFNKKWQGKVKEETVKIVLQAAKDLGYSPNALARSLNGDRTNIIAVVTGSQTGVFYNDILHLLMSGIQKSGRQALVFIADHDSGMERIVQQVNEFRVDGIIVTSPATKTKVMNFFHNTKIPIVLFNRKLQNSTASAVWTETAAGMENLVNFLCENGMKTAAFIEGYGEKERNNAFKDKAKEKNLIIENTLCGDYTYESGFEAGKIILSKKKKPNVIVCSGDNMALGVIDAARLEFNLRVPEDISVVGFDDNATARLKAYDLTTIKQPVDKMLEFTFEILDELVQTPTKQILRSFDTELIIRGSVKLKEK